MSTADDDNSKDCIICVVTGGSGGIGQCIIQALFKTTTVTQSRKCHVYGLDLKLPAAATAASSSSSSSETDKQVTYRVTDVSDPKAFTQELESIFNRHGRIDLLVHNAGKFETPEHRNRCWNKVVMMNHHPEDQENVDDDDDNDDDTDMKNMDELLKTNLGSVIHGTRTLAKLYSRQRRTTTTTTPSLPPPKVINIASTAALAPFEDHPVYGCTKAAVLYFSQTADIDLRKRCNGMRVFCICPGIIDTEMGRLGGKRNADAVAQLQGGKRTKPELVASAVMSLLEEGEKEKDHQKNDTTFEKPYYLVVDNHQIQKKFFSSC